MSKTEDVTAATVTVADLQELRASVGAESPLTAEIDQLTLTVFRGSDAEAVLAARARCAELVSDHRREARESRERAMFGCTEAVIDAAIVGKDPRDTAMYAMSVLSDAQELIRPSSHGWSVASDRDVDTVRKLINVAKYVISKAVPR